MVVGGLDSSLLFYEICSILFTFLIFPKILSLFLCENAMGKILTSSALSRSATHETTRKP